MSVLVSFNGVIFTESEVRLPVSDRGFLFGDGVFTSLRVKDGAPENILKHLERLNKDCRAIKIIPPEIPLQWIDDFIIANNALKGCWRLKIIITGGMSKELSLKERQAGNVLMVMSKYTKEELNPCRLCLYPSPVVTPTAKIKTLAYLNRLYIKDYAADCGFSDSLTVDFQGNILESAFSNIFWVVDDVLYTPSEDLPLLSGTFLTSVLEEALKNNISVVQVRAHLEDIPPNAAVFICNALTGIQPVDSIEDRVFSQSRCITLFNTSQNSGY